MRRVDQETVTIEFTREEVDKLRDYLEGTCHDGEELEEWSVDLLGFLRDKC